MIDVVIPTMWMSDSFESGLKVYIEHPQVNKIIIIDNNKNQRPDYSTLAHKKVELVCYGRNIYVNPAWNEGYRRSTADILCIVNDDIVVDSSVIDMVVNHNLQPGDVIGVNLRGYQDNYKIDDYIDTAEEIVKLNYIDTEPIGKQAWAFGICMFMLRATYREIPNLYQIWYGDDYLVQHARAVYAINSNKIKGKISETLVKFKNPDSDISRRIELDSMNLLKFNHFKNGRNWDVPNNIIEMYRNQRKKLATDHNVFESEYQLAKKIPSDINENVHILYELAQQCKTAVEMGVRSGVSTRALLNAGVDLLAFDLELDHNVQKLFDQAPGKNVKYIQDNVLEIEIEPTDLLFIDTFHTYDQLKRELELHGNKAKKYIALHDTYTFGLAGEDSQDKKGLLTAVIEFMIKNPHWKFKIHRTNNNGFTVLERHTQ